MNLPKNLTKISTNRLQIIRNTQQHTHTHTTEGADHFKNYTDTIVERIFDSEQR